jgi:TatD family-associated radical SAM protein
MTITYEYGNNLYVNTTNRCTCACTFCIRSYGDGVGTGSNLWLEREPTREEILADIQSRDLTKYAEVVFCGYGEPTYRIDDILWVCDRLKAMTPAPAIRMDTNGHGNLINGRDITPEIKGRIDVLSISLNRSTEDAYDEVVRPHVPGAFEAMKDFTRRATANGITVIMTVVDNMDPAEIERCRVLCQQDLGATFRVREFSEDWT